MAHEPQLASQPHLSCVLGVRGSQIGCYQHKMLRSHQDHHQSKERRSNFK